ncbi:MAG: sulfurtransferase [Betaproteobacteria bacterium]|uniref:Putative sulfurtransferase n=1 Tax=Thiomonas delicata TaxID=364030 RepID=A0A238D4U1_THIDL|nr:MULTISPECIES: rhodanese-like domain-containing protein [Thiomonas]MDE2128660.1 sulfurtransferase [Betaproteobacteria bacterium]SBP88316.1 putative sulfurtransferase [Thiomonas delicata]
MKLVKWIGIGILGAAAQIASAAGLPGPLVTPQWLHEHLNEVTVVDIRDDMKTFTAEPKYETDKKTGKKTLVETGGHIAGAISVDFNKIRQERTVDGVKIKAQLPTAEYFTKVMDDFGLNKTDKPIVIVPTGESVDSMDMATRLYFQLRYFGEPRDKLAILNGGVNAWLQAGFPVSTDKAANAKGDWTAGPEDKAILASLQQVKEGLQNGSDQFIDARPTAQFLGIVKKPINKTGGHLPGAKSFPTDAIVKPVGAAHEFMSAEDYKKIFAEFNIQPNAPTVTYCNTGHLASGAWFVAHEIMGNKNSKLYTGSMIEWTNLGNPTVGLPQ